MKTDLYTKVTLTIIAVCLTILTLQNVDLIPKAYAKDATINDLEISSHAKKYALVPVKADGSIDVNIKSSSEMDVNINNVSTSDELNINIDEVGGFSTFGEVPVKIK